MLLIEDDESVLDAIVASLESIGITQVTVARDGESGLAMIDAVRPAVVLLDLMLPVRDGFDVLAKLRQRRSGLQPERIVVISAMSDALSESALLQLGADFILSKPFTLERLEAAVTGG
ncbi:MAG: response regulator [Chloroflexi bacterium]|nr:response regulator [Chloroflexota bacterium]